ncbi:MAG: hypothetical protein GEU90_16380 [Gemmatimonas sp.]|nr:hypothetical protein [Gemmatimonas sp.]
MDDAYVYRVVEPNGRDRSGLIAPSDTVQMDSIGAGVHEVELSHIAPNCVMTSDGGRRQQVGVTPPTVTEVAFRIRCSDPSEQPRILRLASSYHDGASAFFVEAVDPNADLDTYAWNITDCRGNSVTPTGTLERHGLSTGRTARGDTVRFAVTVRVGEPDNRMDRRCTTLRVGDLRGNTSEIAEHRMGSPTGTAPTAREFNARLIGASAVRTTVVPEDVDGDFASVFVSVILRDGVLGRADGEPDVGVFNVYGYTDPTAIPDLPLGSSIGIEDVLGVTVDLIDEAGNFRRFHDDDLLQ